MDTLLTGPDFREQRLDEVIAAYFDDVALERAPRREELFARWPDLAGDLEAFFADCDRVDRLAAPLRQTSRVIGPRGASTHPPGAAPLTGPPSQAGVAGTLSFPVEAPPEVPVHPAFAGYEVLGELGRGGMGVVYKAFQFSLKRTVALKVLRAGPGAEADELARFRAEAEAVAHLKHPNIVQIYEVGEHEGQPFFCLEFLEGGSLSARLAGAPLPPGSAVAVVETLARAIHFAHEASIIHRDLKPANVLLAGRTDTPVEQCVPKVSDFGLAKRLDSEGGQTASGAIVGTPSYMAPEQASGQSRQVGPLADVWALGAILYECLTGHPPFKSALVMDTLLQVLHQEPVPPRRLQPTCPRDVETICLKCLQKDPHKRYASALDLAQDLRRFLDGEPIRARPASSWERGMKWARRRPAVAALVAVSCLAVLVLVVSLRVAVNEARDGERTARKAKDEAEQVALRADYLPQLKQARDALQPEGLQQKQLDLAEKLALKVRAAVREEPSLADLKAEAEKLRTQVEHLRKALENYQGLFLKVDEALFQLNRPVFTGLDETKGPAAAQREAREAVAPFRMDSEAEIGPDLDTCYSDREKERIILGCYHALLIQADALARPLLVPTAGKPATTRDRKAVQLALRILERANKLIPPTQVYLSSQLRRARYLALLGENGRARQVLALADKRQPISPFDAFLVGSDRWLEGQMKGQNSQAALRDLERALQDDPELFWARLFLAVGLKVPQPDQARAHLEVCISQRRGFVWSYLIRGYIHSELRHDFPAAEGDFKTAAQLIEGSKDQSAEYVLLVNRGVMRVRQQRYDIAIKDLKDSIEVLPGHFHAHLNLATAYRQQGKWQAALTELDEAVRLRSSLALLYRERALLHLLRKNRGAALENFQQAIAAREQGVRKTHEDYLECGLIHYQERRYEDAARAADDALWLQPDYSSAHRLRAEALLQLKRYDEAIRSFDRYLERGPVVVPVLQGRALAAAALGNYAAAAEDYTRALALPPDAEAIRTGRSAAPATLRAARGWCYLANDAWPLALRDFEEAIRLDPKSGDAHNGLGFARARLGDHAGAARAARTALRLGPRDERMLYNSARVFAQAVAAVEAERGTWTRQREETAVAYREEALACLAAALALLPEMKREAFWREVISPDLPRVLAPIRRSQGFARLAARYHRPAE